MIRISLLAAICLAAPAFSQTSFEPDTGACTDAPHSLDNCVRVVGCLGDQGLHFEGKVRGWEQGTVSAEVSDATLCSGTWSNEGPLGTGVAQLSCNDGTTMDVIYYSQDGITGTTIGRGHDSLGRLIQAWSGQNVLQFLTPDGQSAARLPCISGDVPLS